MEQPLLDIYSEVRECDYKGEHYSVRDNGAIMRHPKKQIRPNDNQWITTRPGGELQRNRARHRTGKAQERCSC